MDIAIPMYDRFTALDAVGPYEVLSRLPEARVTWLAHEPGLVRTDNHMLAIEATAAFEDLPAPDIVLVPGGTGTRDLLGDERHVDADPVAFPDAEARKGVCTPHHLAVEAVVGEPPLFPALAAPYDRRFIPAVARDVADAADTATGDCYVFAVEIRDAA